MFYYIALFLAHTFGWFLFSILVSIFHGKVHSIKITTAIPVGMISAGFHLLIVYLLKGV